eukprot:CAMPEP_0204236682 /NCGR_PEP_ID=MMETSP0361-20130328/92669_1 /ASSEMBLY_ACC=CAM_ASM_000343 /TAXON_ID=268821 /ORGANISM="Scrippsiella Hangoei, Strain SHTV-5" /LENGTH=117 /DNA_ID=CAMNT_0051208813 /DNA_START=30 /DNA_END=383 /DNA_ORIENTATION=-
MPRQAAHPCTHHCFHNGGSGDERVGGERVGGELVGGERSPRCQSGIQDSKFQTCTYADEPDARILNTIRIPKKTTSGKIYNDGQHVLIERQHALQRCDGRSDTEAWKMSHRRHIRAA